MHLGYNYSGFAQGQIATSKLHISIVIPESRIVMILLAKSFPSDQIVVVISGNMQID